MKKRENSHSEYSFYFLIQRVTLLEYIKYINEKGRITWHTLPDNDEKCIELQGRNVCTGEVGQVCDSLITSN